MNSHYLHLLVNHFPIIGTFIALLVMVAGLLRKQVALQQTSLVIWVLLAALNFLVMKTGEEAEESLESQAGFSEQQLHIHEEAAETAHFLLIALGLSAGMTLALHKRAKIGQGLTLLTTAVSIAALLAAVQAGKEGGAIRHADVVGKTHAVQGPEKGIESGERED